MCYKLERNYGPTQRRQLNDDVQIHCLVITGTVLTDEIRDHLFDTAQKIMARKERAMRLSIPRINLAGEVMTRYKFVCLETITGFEFDGIFDWQEGSARTKFIVRPVKGYSGGLVKWSSTHELPDEVSTILN